MTQFWGPIGWMTLHSISAIYSDNPTPVEKKILIEFMSLFKDTITCYHCQSHFAGMFEMYTKQHPDWADSREKFFLFVCRAHNTVNKRLDKPIILTVKDCIYTLHNNTKVVSDKTYRNNYIQYLLQNWSKEFSGEGMMKVSLVRKMKLINDQFWNLRDLDTTFTLPESSVIEFISDNPKLYHVGPSMPNIAKIKNIRIGFLNGKFRTLN